MEMKQSDEKEILTLLLAAVSDKNEQNQFRDMMHEIQWLCCGVTCVNLILRSKAKNQ